MNDFVYDDKCCTDDRGNSENRDVLRIFAAALKAWRAFSATTERLVVYS